MARTTPRRSPLLSFPRKRESTGFDRSPMGPHPRTQPASGRHRVVQRGCERENLTRLSSAAANWRIRLAGPIVSRHEEERHDPRLDRPRWPRIRRHGCRPVRGRRGNPRGPHRSRGQDRRRSTRRAGRPRPQRGAGFHRRAQPLRLHPAGGPPGGERHPPGGDHGGHRQLRPRLLPDPGSGAVEPHRLRVRRHRAPGLVHPGCLPGAARASRARRQRHDPGTQWPASPGHGGARLAPRERRRDRGHDPAAGGGDGSRRLGLLHGFGVCDGAGCPGAGDHGVGPGCRPHGRLLRHPHPGTGAARRRGGGRGHPHRPQRRRQAPGLPSGAPQRSRPDEPLHRPRGCRQGGRRRHRLRHAHPALRPDLPLRDAPALGDERKPGWNRRGCCARRKRGSASEPTSPSSAGSGTGVGSTFWTTTSGPTWVGWTSRR